MSIKQSELNRKWYSMCAKIFFWLFQTVFAIATLSQGKGIFIVFDLIIGFVLWLLILIGIWKIIVYLIHGKIEKDDDMRKYELTTRFKDITTAKKEWVLRIVKTLKINSIIKTILLGITLIIALMYFTKQFEFKFFSYSEERCQEQELLYEQGWEFSEAHKLTKRYTGRDDKYTRKKCKRPSLIKSCAPFCSFPIH